jgi:hypothetical protein
MVEREQSTQVEPQLTPDESFMEEYGHVLWPAAKIGFEQSGRGALMVDTTVHKQAQAPDSANPFIRFGYMCFESVKNLDDQNLTLQVLTYDPRTEFVAVLVRPDATTSYLVGVLAEKNHPIP